MTSSSKKRTYEDERRRFKSEWEEAYAFTSSNGKPVCLICQTTISRCKVFNLKRHYETLHLDFASEYPSESEVRKSILTQLKANLLCQQTLQILSSFSCVPETVTEAGFVISWNTARAKRPCHDEECIKTTIADVVSVLDPENTKLQQLISQIPMSNPIAARRISQISADIEEKLYNDLKNCVAFSLALDEIACMHSKPQLAIFIRFVAMDMTIHEELLDVITLQETSHGVNMKTALDAALAKSEVNLDKLVSFATDGASSMLCKNLGLIGLLNSDPKYPEFLPVHCIIHVERLVTRYFNYENVIKTSFDIISFIRSNAEAQILFKNFLEELELELITDSVVDWFSSKNVLHRFIEQLDPIVAFLTTSKIKEKNYWQLDDVEWMQDLMFFADILPHLNSLSVALRGKDRLISDLAQTTFSFEKKIQLLQRDLISRDFNHFPHLKSRLYMFPKITGQDRKLQEYKYKLQELLDDFRSRFDGLKSLKPSFAFLINPFVVDVINDGFPITKPILGEVSVAEMELLELQEDQVLQMVHKTHTTAEFWKIVPENKYPQLRKASCRLISVFGTLQFCEILSSKTSCMKSKYCAYLTNQHMSEHLRVACTNYQPDLKCIATTSEIQTTPGSSSD